MFLTMWLLSTWQVDCLAKDRQKKQVKRRAFTVGSVLIDSQPRVLPLPDRNGFLISSFTDLLIFEQKSLETGIIPDACLEPVNIPENLLTVTKTLCYICSPQKSTNQLPTAWITASGEAASGCSRARSRCEILTVWIQLECKDPDLSICIFFSLLVFGKEKCLQQYECLFIGSFRKAYGYNHISCPRMTNCELIQLHWFCCGIFYLT